MLKLVHTLRLLLSGKHRLTSYSAIELIALLAIVAFFVLMLRL